MRGPFFGGPRGWFFYSLGAVALLVIGASVFFGVSFLSSGEEPAERAATPAETQEVQKVPEKTVNTTVEEQAAEDKAKEAEDKRKAEEEAARKAAEEKAAKEKEATEKAAREEAARQAALEQYAAEQAAAEQYAIEQAALEQYAAEQAAAEQYTDPASLFPQAMAAPSSTTFYLSVPKLGLSNIPVVDDTSEWGLSQGAGHLPGTGFPWIPGSNTYIAGHRLGYPGTASDHVFYDLPSLVAGDQIVVTDSSGQSYAYVVSEVLEVSPYDLSVTAPVVGRDVLTLQTCIENFGDYWTPGPNWLARYVVRADRVA